MANRGVNIELSALVFWIMRLGDGTIFSKDNLKLYIQESQITLDIGTSSESASLLNSLGIGNLYSGTWEMVSLNMKLEVSQHKCTLRNKTTRLIDEKTITPEWTDTLANFKFGENFEGFIYSIQIYDDILSDADLTGSSFFVEESLCYYPAFAGGCLSTEPDHLENKDGQRCACPDNVSCLEDTTKCIETTCDVYAESAYPYDCLDPSSLCGAEIQYLYQARKCNFECILDCEECPNDPICDECSPGFVFELGNGTSNDGSCVCPEGHYVSSGACLSCGSNCESCSDASTCDNCSDPSFSLISGSCTCRDGYFEENGRCESCEETCLRCNSESCLECESGKEIAGKECVLTIENCEVYNSNGCSDCEQGFYLDSQGACNQCEIACELCTGSSSCTKCKDINSEIIDGRCECSKAHSYMKEGFCECEEGFSKAEGTDLICSEEDQQTTGNTQKEEEPLEEIEIVVYSTVAGLTVSFISMVTMDDPTSLWTLLNTYQFISYLPLLSIPYPSQVSNYLYSLQLAKFLPNLFTFLEVGEELPRRFKEYGEEKEEFLDDNCIRNTGRYILLLAILLFLNILFMILGPFLSIKKIKESALKSRSSWMSSVLRIWNTVNFDLSLSSSIVIFSQSDSSFSSMIWGICILQLNLLLLVVLYKYTDDNELIQNKDPGIYNKIETFLEELSNDSLWSSRYYLLLNMRKMLSTALIFFFHDTPAIVLYAQIALSFLFCIYFVVGKVFEKRLTTFLYFIAELTIFITFLGSLLILEHEEYSSEMGYMIIGTNIVFLLIGTFLKIVLAAFSCIIEKFKTQKNAPTNVTNLNANNVNSPSVMNENKEFIESNSNWKDRYAMFLKRSYNLY